MKRSPLQIHALVLSLLLTCLLAWLGVHFTEIDTDVTSFLPQDTPVFSDAQTVFNNHPLHDQMIIDLGSKQVKPDILVQLAQDVENRMQDSGLFEQVGTEDFQEVIPQIIPDVVAELPVLFNSQELEKHIAPLLESQALRQRLQSSLQSMHDLSTLGQGRYIAQDPLGMRNIVLSRLQGLAPTDNVQLEQGRIFSSDRKHLLLVAYPKSSGTDTASARELQRLFADISESVLPEYETKEHRLTITPMGSYRIALDNENIIRKDVTKAVFLATAGIALLLLAVFPRPLIGLLAFLPALTGTAAAFFTMSLFHQSISLMVLGFGGAIISITVDHGIACLLFLDRSRTTTGREASREVLAIGLLTALTTMGAFSALCLTGFPFFVQLGQFSALGIGYSFLAVHVIIPRLFPVLPPTTPRRRVLRSWLERIPLPKTWGLYAAGAWIVIMALLWDPTFNVDLQTMNTVSDKTQQAEEQIASVWGEASLNKAFIVTQAGDMRTMRMAWDQLAPAMKNDLEQGVLTSGLLPSMIYPGPELRQKNFQSWRDFWTPERVERLTSNLKSTGPSLGFRPQAFTPFLESIQKDAPPAIKPIPKEAYPLFHITSPDKGWLHFATVTPGPEYKPHQLYDTYATPHTSVFDPAHFSRIMGKHLSSSFIQLLVIIGSGVLGLLIFFFLNLRLAAIAILPVLFALVSTLGTLSALGRPVDIPGLMLSIVVFGMGIDYSLLITRAQQRYGSMHHSQFLIIKTTVILAGLSTCIGFGVMIGSSHSMLHSAGLTSFIGIFYSLLGTFLILPPLLRPLFATPPPPSQSSSWSKRVRARYRHLEAYPRVFAACKLRFDPMFKELPRFLDREYPAQAFLDIGGGYGVPACCLLEWFPQARVTCIEPDPERCRIAARVLADRGRVQCSGAPDIPAAEQPIDAALMLDVSHYLSDADLRETLSKISFNLHARGPLIVRAVVPPQGRRSSFLWKIQAL
ncbi:MAG: MMPL family transporter, partial [Desulfovermiculus sp.]